MFTCEELLLSDVSVIFMAKIPINLLNVNVNKYTSDLFT